MLEKSKRRFRCCCCYVSVKATDKVITSVRRHPRFSSTRIFFLWRMMKIVNLVWKYHNDTIKFLQIWSGCCWKVTLSIRCKGELNIWSRDRVRVAPMMWRDEKIFFFIFRIQFLFGKFQRQLNFVIIYRPFGDISEFSKSMVRETLEKLWSLHSFQWTLWWILGKIYFDRRNFNFSLLLIYWLTFLFSILFIKIYSILLHFIYSLVSSCSDPKQQQNKNNKFIFFHFELSLLH